jgi:antitoxin MazE
MVSSLYLLNIKGDTMQTRIQKWGNSLALRIPRAFAAETHLEQDTLVEITLQDGRIVVAPVAASFTLEQLLAQVTPENVHTEQEIGVSVGNEAWE